jgi:hypothetical protein
MRNVLSKRRKKNYSANDNNTEDTNPQLSHKSHVPTAIRFFFCFLTLQKGFLFPGKYFSFRISNDFHSSGSLHSSCSRQTGDMKQQSTKPNGQNGIVGPDPARTRSVPISPEVCRSQQPLVVHTATRATSNNPHCSILQQLHHLRYVLTRIKPCRFPVSTNSVLTA